MTLRDVLLREWEIVQTVKEGVGDCHPLVANPLSANPALDDEQRKALDALLCSRNTVSLFVVAREQARVLFCAKWSSKFNRPDDPLSSLRRSVSKS